MEADIPVTPILVMGVTGSGKSTVAVELAQRLGWAFLDADWLHSPENIAKMSSGIALSDEDRWPWLTDVGQRLHDEVSTGRGVVVACSALKRSYRDLLRDYVQDLFVVFLDGTASVLQARIDARSGSFMAPSLLGSQLATLEPLFDDEAGMRVPIEQSSVEVVQVIVARLESLGLA
jgi:gluconokinase